MKKQKEILKDLKIDKTWTLFLDRDGVINKKLEKDYVKKIDEFEFLPGTIDALKILSSIFGKIIIVTNQRGIGKGLMSEKDLENIHIHMLNILNKYNITITKIYYCPHDYEKEECNCRKPKIGMALMAKKDFPDIEFSKSIMIGDSISDIEFGKNAGMISILLNEDSDITSLKDFALYLQASVFSYL